MCISQHQPKEHLWVFLGPARFPRILRLEGQATFPRRCWGSAAGMGLGKPSRQVRRYRCMCWGHVLGQKSIVVNFLALVRDQKLRRQEQLKK